MVTSPGYTRITTLKYQLATSFRQIRSYRSRICYNYQFRSNW